MTIQTVIKENAYFDSVTLIPFQHEPMNWLELKPQ